MFWRGVIGYLPVNIVQGVVGLLNIVVFTRLLPPEAYGAYALAFSVMSLVHTLTFTWLESAMARFYAPQAEAGRLPDHFATLYRAFATLALGFPLLAGLALWFWPMGPDLKLAVGAGLASILGRSLAKLAQERRRAAGDVRGAALMDMGVTAGGFALGAGLALMGLGGAAPLAGAGAAAAICVIFTLPTELKRLGHGRMEPWRLKAYAAYGLPISLSLVMALALATTDRFLLAYYLDTASVGVYHAGYSLANRTLDVIFIWLGMAGAPAAIAAFERGGQAALRPALLQQGRLMLLIATPAAVGLALVACPLSTLMVGRALSQGAAHVTPFIAFSAFFAGITTYYLHQAFTLARRTGLLMIAMAVPAASNLALNLWLIPRMGLDGALWATAVSYLLGAGASYGLGRRVLALPIPWDTLARCLLASAGMAALLLTLPELGGLPELILKAVVGVAAYSVLALGLDAGGARSQLRQAVRTAQARWIQAGAA